MSNTWQGRREGGGYIALWLIRSIGLQMGRPLARALLYPITLYFFLRRGPERRASRAYLRRLWGRPVRQREVLQHIYVFASSILDRAFLLHRGERGYHFVVEGLDLLEQTLAQGRGVLLYGAHLGSFEALRTLAARHPDLQLRVVMDRTQTPAMNALLEELDPQLAKNVIDVGADRYTVALAVSEAVQEGAIVALLADRARHHETTRSVPFLGAPAPFPVSPWRLAAAVRAPVLLCFAIERGNRNYLLRFERFAERIELPRSRGDATLDSVLMAYAARLEALLREYPYHWFNFYDFWKPHVQAAGDLGHAAAQPAGERGGLA